MSKVRPRSKYRKDVNRFASIPSINIKRSVLPRSFEYKTTFDAGYLIPFYYFLHVCGGVSVEDTGKNVAWEFVGRQSNIPLNDKI